VRMQILFTCKKHFITQFLSTLNAHARGSWGIPLLFIGSTKPRAFLLEYQPDPPKIFQFAPR
jgi:hypothetical protein